jgi:uncharacterized protein
MSGETDLQSMLSDLKPVLLPDRYVFCTVKDADYGDLAHTQPLASFRETEGLTLVVSEESALREALEFEGTFRCITLQVHSSLEAVGLTAAVADALAKQNICANVIAGYYHDHVFVPSDRADHAVALLQSLNRNV